jgi:hypothetical protein
MLYVGSKANKTDPGNKGQNSGPLVKGTQELYGGLEMVSVFYRCTIYQG